MSGLAAPPRPSTTELPDPDAVLGQAAAENFPVALRLLGPRLGRDLMAIYGAARLIDDVGDEVDGDRLALLDELEVELEMPRHPLMVDAVATIQARGLSRDPFRRLIEANRRDQVVERYDSFAELWDYCMLSAAPVGQIVLELFGQATPERVALSDCVCNGLQVIEHLQDVEEDAARGRVYIGDFDALTHAATLLGAGPPLVRSLHGRARLAVAGFLAGGRLALAELADAPAPTGGLAGQTLRALAGR